MCLKKFKQRKGCCKNAQRLLNSMRVLRCKAAAGISYQPLQRIALYLLLLIAFTAITYAANETVISSKCAQINAFDYAGQMECEIDSYALTSNKVLIDRNQLLSAAILNTTRMAVDINAASSYFSVFWYLFGSLFLLLVIYAGYKYMASAAFPEKRAEAKNQLKSIVVIAIVMAGLTFIIDKTSELSEATTAGMLEVAGFGKGGNESFFYAPSFEPVPQLNVTVDVERFSRLFTTSPLFIKAANLYVISMNGRVMIVLLLVAIAPIIVFLYYFHPTAEYGRLFTYLFFVEMFLPALNIIIFGFGSRMYTDEAGHILALTSALILCIILHLSLLAVSILKASLSMITRVRGGNPE